MKETKIMKNPADKPKQPKQLFTSGIGIVCGLGSLGLAIWISSNFSQWLVGAVGNQGLINETLLAFLPTLVTIGSYFGLFIGSILLVIKTRLWLNPELRENPDPGPEEWAKPHPEEDPTPVVSLERSEESKNETTEYDSTYFILSALGFVIWTLSFGLLSESQSHPAWYFWVVYGLGVVAWGTLFHEGFHHHHEAVRQYLPARTLNPNQRSGIVLGMSVILLVLAAFAGKQTQERLKRDDQTTEGVVTKLVYHPGYRSGHTNVQVQFTDLRGTACLEECWGGPPPGQALPREGDRVEVIYDPQNPAEATLKDFGGQLWGSISLGGLSLILFIAGVVRAIKEGSS